MDLRRYSLFYIPNSLSLEHSFPRNSVEVWRMALEDPHLIPLGDWVTSKMGPVETARFFREGGKDAMKDVFTGGPCQPGPLIVEVANPENHGKVCRFVVVWDNKSGDHSNCNFFQHLMSKKTGVEAGRQKSLQDGRPTWLEGPRVEEGELPAFVPWEEIEAKECDHDLVKELFVNKRQKPKKMMTKKKTLKKSNKKEKNTAKTDKKHKKTKKMKKPSKAAKQDLSCKEKVDERILRVLMSSCKMKKKTDSRKSKVSVGMAPGVNAAHHLPGFLKEITARLKMIRSVKAKRLVRKRILAKQLVGKLMDNLIGRVVRSVEGKLARVDMVVRTLLEKVNVMKEDDLR